MQGKISMQASKALQSIIFHQSPFQKSTHKTLFIILMVLEREERKEFRLTGLALGIKIRYNKQLTAIKRGSIRYQETTYQERYQTEITKNCQKTFQP